MSKAKRNVRKGNGHRYREAVARLRGQRRGCWICRAFGRPDAIDYALPAGDPWAFQADHLVPASKGGSLYSLDNLDATHARCNNWRKTKSVAEVMELARRARGDSDPVVPTTDW